MVVRYRWVNIAGVGENAFVSDYPREYCDVIRLCGVVRELNVIMK